MGLLSEGNERDHLSDSNGDDDGYMVDQLSECEGGNVGQISGQLVGQFKMDVHPEATFDSVDDA